MTGQSTTFDNYSTSLSFEAFSGQVRNRGFGETEQLPSVEVEADQNSASTLSKIIAETEQVFLSRSPDARFRKHRSHGRVSQKTVIQTCISPQRSWKLWGLLSDKCRGRSGSRS